MGIVNRVAEDTLQGNKRSHYFISLPLKTSMKKDQDLIVITKTYDLILWSCNHTGKFPRNHRFVLGERIERNLYNLLETLITAKYTKNRQRLLEEANLNLEILPFQMRLAKDLQCVKQRNLTALRSANQRSDQNESHQCSSNLTPSAACDSMIESTTMCQPSPPNDDQYPR